MFSPLPTTSVNSGALPGDPERDLWQAQPSGTRVTLSIKELGPLKVKSLKQCEKAN